MTCRLCFFSFLTALQFVAFGALAQVNFEERLAEGQPPAVSAHRSAYMAGYPENSLAWMQYAMDRGVDIVHINPQVTADDQYVLMHDHTLNRTTDVESVYPDGVPGGPSRKDRWGKDYVRDYTLSELKKLRLINGEDGGSHKVPSLAEALDLANGKILVRLGLKSYEVDSLASVLGQYDPSSLMLFELYRSDTDQGKLLELSEATGVGVSVALLGPKEPLEDLDDIVGQLGSALRMVTVGSRDLTPDFLAKVRELGLYVEVGGWDGPEDYALLNESDPTLWQAVLNLGFTASTDQPDLVLRILGR